MNNIGKINSKIIIALAILISLFCISILGINANPTIGSATIGYTSNTTATLGNEIIVKINVNNIDISSENIGICGVGGNFSFDSEYLEYISGTGMTSPYSVAINEQNNYKFAGIDFTLANGFNKNTDIITLKFKPKKKGSTTLSVSNVLLNDCNNNKLSVTTSSKTISIIEPVVKDSNNNLSDLSITGYDINPAFNKDITNYSLNIPNNISTIIVNATKESNKATISGTGTKNINVGSNTLQVIVTAENGNKKIYSIIVNREGSNIKSNDNSLKSLVIDGYDLNPSFNPNTTDYTVTIPNEATSVIVNATKNNNKATLNIIGNNNLKVGDNEVSVEVIAEDGNKKIYKINVVRKEASIPTPVLESDATLSKLDIGGYTLSPSFNSNKFAYSMTVGNNIDGLSVQAIAKSSKSKVTISGNSGWKVGINQITITVTAENGNKNIYVVNVTKQGSTSQTESNKSSENYIEKLVVSNGEIKPSFNKNTSNYTINIPYENNKLELDYKISNKAKLEINGNNNLKVGLNTITMKVTAEDGSVRIYTLNVTRSVIKSDNDLENIRIDGKKLDDNFDPDNLNYKLTVDGNTDSLDVEAITKNPNAKVEITGNKDLKEGNNVVMVRVTDENGFTKSYQIDVEKKSKKVLGMNIGQFIGLLSLILLLVSIIIMLMILIKRKNKQKEDLKKMSEGTKIEFKPEINIGAKNGTDDDIIYPNGNLYQDSKLSTEVPKQINEPKKVIDEDTIEADYEEKYDLYDDVVTKDELYDALEESLETNNSDKLKMLLKQEEVNRLKKEIKEKLNKSSKYDTFDDDEF